MRAGAVWLKNPVVVQFHAKIRGFKDTRNYSHPSEKAKLGAAKKTSFQVSDSPLSARLLDDAPLMGANKT